MPTKSRRNSIKSCGLTEEEIKFCNSTIRKVANKLGWEILREGLYHNSKTMNNSRIHAYIPDNSALPKARALFNNTRSTDISLHGKNNKLGNWLALVMLIKHFGGDVVSVDFMKAIRYLNHLVDNPNTKGEQAPTV